MNKIWMKLARPTPFCIVNAVLHHGRPVVTQPLDSINLLIRSYSWALLGVLCIFLSVLPPSFVLPLCYPSMQPNVEKGTLIKSPIEVKEARSSLLDFYPMLWIARELPVL